MSNLQGKLPHDTYQSLVQLTQSAYLADGTGSILKNLNITASFAVTSSFEFTSILAFSSSFASSSVSSSHAISSSFASVSPQGLVRVEHSDGTATVYSPATDTDIDRGNALLTASANFVAGDVCFLSNHHYDLRNKNVDPSIGGADVGAIIRGAGMFSTVITSSAVLTSVDAIFILGSYVEISDLSIFGNASQSLYQAGIGIGGQLSGRKVTSASIKNVHIEAGSDAVYINPAFPSTVRLENVTCRTKFDALYTLNANVDAYNCSFNSISASDFGNIVRHGVNNLGPTCFTCNGSNSGIVNLYNCSFNVEDGFGIVSAGAGAITNVRGGSFTSCSKDLFAVTDAVLGVTSDTTFDILNKLSGSITFLDSIYQATSSAVVPATQNTASGWLAIKVAGQTVYLPVYQ